MRDHSERLEWYKVHSGLIVGLGVHTPVMAEVTSTRRLILRSFNDAVSTAEVMYSTNENTNIVLQT